MKKLIFTILISILLPVSVLAWNDCPYSETNCAEPGKCGGYTDTNNDRLCDNSQANPDPVIKQNNTVNIKNKKMYHLVPITVVLIFLYLISYALSKKKIISVLKHRKLWNILLTISFLISAIFGILLTIRINFGLTSPQPINILFWHVETGIAMAVISIFHISWHWQYFKNIFK